MSLRLELNELEKKFREVAMRRFNYSKGALKKASEEALKRWIAEQQEIPKSENPLGLIEGILEKFKGKASSIELQHSVSKLWAE